MIARGMFHFARSAAGDEITEYHLQAGIAACHCTARDFASSDWRQILSLYDRLVTFDDSPVVALNRVEALRRSFRPVARQPETVAKTSRRMCFDSAAVRPKRPAAASARATVGSS